MRERVSTLSPTLKCPRCFREFEIAELTDIEQFRGFPTCRGGSPQRRCGQRWWALMLEPGDVMPQLAKVFGEDLAIELMLKWALPASVRQQLFWQLSISAAQYEQHGRAGSQLLLKFLASLVPSQANQ